MCVCARARAHRNVRWMQTCVHPDDVCTQPEEGERHALAEAREEEEEEEEEMQRQTERQRAIGTKGGGEEEEVGGPSLRLPASATVTPPPPHPLQTPPATHVPSTPPPSASAPHAMYEPPRSVSRSRGTPLPGPRKEPIQIHELGSSRNFAGEGAVFQFFLAPIQIYELGGERERVYYKRTLASIYSNDHECVRMG